MKYGPEEDGINLSHTGSSFLDPWSGQARGLGIPRDFQLWVVSMTRGFRGH